MPYTPLVLIRIAHVQYVEFCLKTVSAFEYVVINVVPNEDFWGNKTSIIICLLFFLCKLWLFSPLFSGVLVNYLSKQNKTKKALTCSIWQFLWCKSFHLYQFTNGFSISSQISDVSQLPEISPNIDSTTCSIEEFLISFILIFLSYLKFIFTHQQNKPSGLSDF